MANSASGSVGSRARSPTVERHRVRCKVVRIVPRGVSSRGEAVTSPRRTSGRGCLENQASVTTIVPRRYSLGPRKAARPEGARSRAPTVAKAKPERTGGRVNPTRSGTCSPSARMTVTAASANIETTRRRPVNRTPPLPRRRSAPLRRPAAPAPASAARAAITAPERLDVVEEGVYLARIDEAYAAEPTAERGTDNCPDDRPAGHRKQRHCGSANSRISAAKRGSVRSGASRGSRRAKTRRLDRSW